MASAERQSITSKSYRRRAAEDDITPCQLPTCSHIRIIDAQWDSISLAHKRAPKFNRLIKSMPRDPRHRSRLPHHSPDMAYGMTDQLLTDIGLWRGKDHMDLSFFKRSCSLNLGAVCEVSFGNLDPLLLMATSITRGPYALEQVHQPPIPFGTSTKLSRIIVHSRTKLNA